MAARSRPLNRLWATMQVVAGLVAVGVLSGCGAPPASLAELNGSYERALARTAPLAVSMAPGSAEEQRALAGIQVYFAGMTPESVRARTSTVYAPEAYLNDTLVGIDGVERIQEYFARTLQRSRVLKVEFLDHAQTGVDYYVRWIMTVEANGLNDGEPVVTYGVTQFRFDAQGRVLVHKDFWDSGSGLYEQLPVLGSVIRRVRAAAEAEAG